MRDIRIAVIGLGRSGLSMAVRFAGDYPVIGFDSDNRRIHELRTGLDCNHEVEPAKLSALLCRCNPLSMMAGICQSGLFVTMDRCQISRSNCFIVANSFAGSMNPLSPFDGIEIAALFLKPRDVVCLSPDTLDEGSIKEHIALLERRSAMTAGRDFTVTVSFDQLNIFIMELSKAS